MPGGSTEGKPDEPAAPVGDVSDSPQGDVGDWAKSPETSPEAGGGGVGPSEPVVEGIARDGRLPIWAVAIEVLLVFFVFFAAGAVPVPEVNEPYYVGKAAHFWNAGGPTDDAFLQSADSHLVFYITCGWLTLLFSQTTVCWIGRIATWLLLAWSWQRLSWAVVPRWGLAAITAMLLVVLRANFHMAGEWLIGGFEGKGFAFVFVFLGIEALVRGRWRWVWPLLGIASAFHVLVGGWSVLAAMIAWMATPMDRRLGIIYMWPFVAIGLILSLPGLIPAVLLTSGASAEIVEQANYIYVFQRLTHHLVPVVMAGAGKMIGRFLLLVIVYFLLVGIVRRNQRLRDFEGFIAGTLCIAAVGMILSLLDFTQPENLKWGGSLLRFYWFRLSDIFVPAGVAILVGAILAGALKRLLGKDPVWDIAVLILVAGLVIGIGIGRINRHFSHHAPAVQASVPKAGGSVSDDGEQRRRRIEAWLHVCKFVAAADGEVIPKDARFITPIPNSTFRWYTGRSEVATWKDIPQDAESICQWWERLERICGGVPNPGRKVSEFGDYNPEQVARRLRDLGKKYGAQFVLTQTGAYPKLETYTDESGVQHAFMQRVPRFLPLGKESRVGRYFDLIETVDAQGNKGFKWQEVSEFLSPGDDPREVNPVYASPYYQIYSLSD